MGTRTEQRLGIVYGLQEATYRERLFYGSNQAATATTVGLATTYTGLCLSNALTSTVNVAVYGVHVAVIGAPAAASVIGLMAGYDGATEVVHTTPITPSGALFGARQPTPVALVDGAATLPASPVLVKAFGTVPITGATAQVVNPPVTGVNWDMKGSLVLEPGAFCAIYTSTVLSVIASLSWTEIPR